MPGDAHSTGGDAPHEAPTWLMITEQARITPHRRHRPLLHFALSSVALLLFVAAIGAVALRHLAKDEALNDARSVTVAFSRGMLRNAVTPGVLREDRAEIAALDRRVHETVLGHPIVRLKVWAPSGRIVYSDAHALIGRRFPLPEDLRVALSDGAVRAEVSDLSRPENRFERGHGPLVEVYLPVRLASGQLVMVEAYHPSERIDAASRRIWGTFLPMSLGLLVALAAVLIPLAWMQSRRARAEAQERESLAREAEHALQGERSRIATELHDGIVQDLAGAAFALHAATALPHGSADAPLREAVAHGADICRTTMTRMRELVVDLRTREDAVQDIYGAIDALARPLRDAGIEVIVGVGVRRQIESDVALLIHRAAREILLAVRGEPNVTLVTMGLRERGQSLVLTVDHDGRELEASSTAPPAHRLHSLEERFADHGGAFTIERHAGRGARYTATLAAT